jgi:NADH:ubiquinone oxidoreductase subunit E
MHHVDEQDLGEQVEIQATFCMEACDRGPTVRVAGHALHRATLEGARELIGKALGGELTPASAIDSVDACHASH